jgi:hypothetical protein
LALVTRNIPLSESKKGSESAMKYGATIATGIKSMRFGVLNEE